MTSTPTATSRRALLAAASLLPLAACTPPLRAGHDAGPGEPALASDSPVARWMDLADRIGSNPGSGWPRSNTVALTARAMHDALNAIEPRHATWLPRNAGAGAGISPVCALSAAARTVLARRGPPAEADALLAALTAAEPSGPARESGTALGTAIGTATLEAAGPAPERRMFEVSDQQGRWRPTSAAGQNTFFYTNQPFLFPARDSLRGPPPPDLASDRYREDVEEVRRLGGSNSPARSEAQTEAANFWVPQLLHRNLMLLLLRRAAARPQRGTPGGTPGSSVWDEARMASILATAHSDTDVFVYGEKAHHAFWRPVTAIGLGSPGAAGAPGIPADPLWQAVLNTPGHPDYPSGHSADITAGTLVIAGLLGEAPVRYQAIDRQGRPTRDFPSLAAMLTECSDSRIWAGAHFRFACNEGQRIGRAIAARALTQVPRLG